MDYILGIMCDYDAEADIVARLVGAHTPVDGIQAIGLGGRPVMRAEGDVDAPVPARLLGDRLKGGSIVGIHAHEDVVIAVTDLVFFMRGHSRGSILFPYTPLVRI